MRAEPEGTPTPYGALTRRQSPHQRRTELGSRKFCPRPRGGPAGAVYGDVLPAGLCLTATAAAGMMEHFPGPKWGISQASSHGFVTLLRAKGSYMCFTAERPTAGSKRFTRVSRHKGQM